MSREKQNKSGMTSRNRFEDRATEPSRGLIAEFWEFLRTNKKWWMLPIIGALLVVAVLVFLGGTALAPFIYTLF